MLALSHFWRFAAFVTVLIAHLATSAAPPARPTDYSPPTFTDPNRADKIRQLADQIDQIYRDHAAEKHFPGIAYGVVVDGQLILSGAHGLANRSNATPVTSKTVFRIASMTKSFTALAILRLRDAGKLDLDQPASRYLPELRRAPLLTRDAPPITLRHLLTHGAGFPEDNPWGDRQLADTEQALIDLIQSPARFSNVPGVAYEYSNLGFALLGRAIHRVSGQRCQNYIGRNVLKPLAMTSTYWDPREVPAHRLAHGYRWQENAWLEEEQLGDGSYASMGGMLSSVEDFARYMALHLSASPPRDEPESPVLRRSSLREMQHPWRFSTLNSKAKAADDSPCPSVGAYGYGLGWNKNCKDRVHVGHSGGLPGFGSNWRILPEYGIGVVAFGNLTYADLGTPNSKALERLIQGANLLPRQLPPSPILQERARQLIQLLPDWTRAADSQIFAENFFPDNPIPLLARRTREPWDSLGTVIRIDPVKPENQLRGTVAIHGDRGDLELFFTLTPENPPLIQEFKIRPLPRQE